MSEFLAKYSYYAAFHLLTNLMPNDGLAIGANAIKYCGIRDSGSVSETTLKSIS